MGFTFCRKWGPDPTNSKILVWLIHLYFAYQSSENEKLKEFDVDISISMSQGLSCIIFFEVMEYYPIQKQNYLLMVPQHIKIPTDLGNYG